mgnify:FL=1
MGQILDFYKTDDRYKDKVNLDVIKFIDTVSSFPDRDGKVSDNIDHLFCAGYCYYFANILKLAFGGKVCWAQDRGHIVWVDCDESSTFDELQNAVAYDITGVFVDYERLFPVEYLGGAIVDYKHTEEVFHLNQDFKDWCDFHKVTEMYAINLIWGLIPEDDILITYKADVDYVSAAHSYWMLHERELRILFEYVKHGVGIHTFPQHCGVSKEIEYVESKMKHRSVNKITSF